MSQSVARHTKCCKTKSTGIWFIPSMNQDMSGHVTFNVSTFMANFASPHFYSLLIYELLDLKIKKTLLSRFTFVLLMHVLMYFKNLLSRRTFHALIYYSWF